MPAGYYRPWRHVRCARTVRCVRGGGKKKPARRSSPSTGAQIYSLPKTLKSARKVKSRFVPYGAARENRLSQPAAPFVSESHWVIFYYKPRTTFDMLKKYAEGCNTSSAMYRGHYSALH